MRSQGIEQWDERYPNVEVLEKDIAENTLYVAWSGEEMLGMVVLNTFQDPEYAELNWRCPAPVLVVHRLCVSPAAQKMGVARALMNYAESFAREQGYASIRLDAFTQNPRAVALYERRGYRRVGKVLFRKGEFWCFELSVGTTHS